MNIAVIDWRDIMSMIEHKFSPFFRDKVLFAPEKTQWENKIISQLSIIYPDRFIVDPDERKIYGCEPTSGKKVKIEVSYIIYYYHKELIDKLDRLRKVCAASVTLRQNDRNYYQGCWPMFNIKELYSVDEKYLIESLHDDDNLVFAMANGLYGVVSKTLQFDHLRYEYRHD